LKNTVETKYRDEALAKVERRTWERCPPYTQGARLDMTLDELGTNVFQSCETVTAPGGYDGLNSLMWQPHKALLRASSKSPNVRGF
jgi:hypothetical protein